MKKVLALVLGLVMCVMLFAGCTDVAPAAPQTDNRSNFEIQVEANEESARNITKQYGTAQLTRSQDYENILRRAEYLNQANNVGYLYLLTANGQLVKESQVLGKVTSLNSYITPMEEVVLVENGLNRNMSSDSTAYPGTYVVVQAPDLDGTYGDNINGIFWFTPDGAYMEWPGLYLFSSERMSYADVELLISTGN